MHVHVCILSPIETLPSRGILTPFLYILPFLVSSFLNNSVPPPPPPPPLLSSFSPLAGNIRPEDLIEEEEVINTQPSTSYQAVDTNDKIPI